MAQASFAELEHDLKKRRTRRELFLEKMDRLVPWERLERRIEPFYPKAGRGRRPYPLAVMLRVHCVQLFYNLSDPGMEDLLYEVESVRRFVGLRLTEALPDEPTILNFRHLLERHDLGAGLFEEINAHLASRGHRLRTGTIVDASIIDAPSSTKTLGVLSKMFPLAEMWGWRPDGSNPCLHIKRYKEEKRERFLSAEEFARLGKVLDEILRDGSETRSAVVAISLLMLTGCRLSEIQKLRWEHVDLEAGELRLPDTKTGGRAVPLAPSAVRLLEALPRDEDNPWVIAGRKPGSHLTDLQHPWRRIRRKAELDDVRIHDLRHSFASRAPALGEGLPMIGKLLGHTQVRTTARYAHLARDTVKASAARIGDSIDGDLATAE